MDLKLLIFSLLITYSVAISYEGYKVYKVVPKTADEVKTLKEVEKNAIGEFWEDHYDVNHEVKIMVSPEKQKAFVDFLGNVNIEVVEVISDLHRTIQDQMNPSNIRSSERLGSLSWDRYYSLEQIHAWLDELAEIYPDVVSTVVMGRSVENREIKGVIINFKPEREHVLLGMLEGTLHAREWISAATVTWIIKEFLTSSNPEIRSLAENFEWHIFPVVNPDGYVYTFTTNRMWRKNRSTASFKACAEGVDDDMTNGVDLNRNFDFMWMTVGASDDSCTNTYAGPEANSEPETRAIIAYVTNLETKGELIYYIAFHSYTQLIIIPYSHLNNGASAGQPSNFADMYEIAIRGSESLTKRFGTVYRVGVSAEVMYPMSGTSFDWVKYAANVPVTYLIELRDLGAYGFLLPASDIEATALEIMDAFLEMDRTTRDLGYYTGSNGVNVIGSLAVVLVGFLMAIL